MVAQKVSIESRISQSLVAIDPGVHLGWAFWPDNKRYPVRCGVVKPQHGKSKDFFLNIHSTTHQLGEIILMLKPKFIVCEWPQSFTSVGGRAASGAGSIIKLAFGIGQLAMIADACEASFIPIPVAQWKGNLSKHIVIKRIKKTLTSARLNYLEPFSHSWDAIGIGLFCKGMF